MPLASFLRNFLEECLVRVCGSIENATLRLVISAFREEIGKHLHSDQYSSRNLQFGAHLDRVQRATSTLRVELNAPNFSPRIRRGFNTFDGRVVAVDEKGLPSGWERVLEFEGVLVVLAVYTLR